VTSKERSEEMRSSSLPAISVVIPTRNHGELLAGTIESCRRHAGGVDLEFVVVDRDSSDDTAARLQKLGAELPGLVWRSVEHSETARALNLGASLARHGILLFLADDVHPRDSNFFRIHAELHARQPATGLAVLGRLEPPSSSNRALPIPCCVNEDGELLDFEHLAPGEHHDWRSFCISLVSVKKDLVEDWREEGFDPAFTLGVFEGAELAYRVNRRTQAPLRVFHTDASVGVCQAPVTLRESMRRQVDAGLMAGVFSELHPGDELRRAIGLEDIHAALSRAPNPRQEECLDDYLSVLRGVESWARLIEPQLQGAFQQWHRDLLDAVLQLGYFEGFTLACADPEADLAGAYRFMLDQFTARMNRAFRGETKGRLLRGGRNLEDIIQLQGEEALRNAFMRSRLRRWAQQRPLLRSAYRKLRGSR
jgi:hypothetical protein